MKDKKPTEIAGYTILPLHLPPTQSFPTTATHYLYLRRHVPRIPDPDASRSLFAVNIPVDTTGLHLRHLFGTQLAAGRVESVSFEDIPTKKSGRAIQTDAVTNTNSKKRKRVTADELQTQLDDVSLPGTYDRRLQKSGAHAVIIFADKPSMEASLRAASKIAKKGDKGAVTWGEGLEDRLPGLGVSRYQSHESLRYPDRADLLRTVNEYMSLYARVNETRKREDARRAQEPDDDGFVTVTRGPRLASNVTEEQQRELVEAQRKREEGRADFYRFQSREKRKERQVDLVRRFEDDRKRLGELRRRRGKVRVSFLFLWKCVWMGLIE